MKKIILAAISCIALTSCLTINSNMREGVKMPGLTVNRTDYILTDDLTAEAEVKYILGGLIVRGDDPKNVKAGSLGGMTASRDEQLAIYNLLEKNPQIDYVTNVRYQKSYVKKIFSKTFKTKVIAKGIILKTDK